jgi:L,D-transpeptidase ErfK/SrfK
MSAATKIAAILAVTAMEIRGAEIGAGEASRKLVISIPDRKIVLIENGQVVRAFPVAVGKASTPTPTGRFNIASQVIDPTWYGPKQVIPPGPRNPVGTRWIGIGYKGYGIHGTNQPRSIGKAASHGCVRMRNQDVEQLFDLVRIGDPVEIVNDAPPREAASEASIGE